MTDQLPIAMTDHKRYPACQSRDRIEVQATVWLRLSEPDVDPSTYRGGYMFDLGSPALCGECGHRAKLRDFHVDPQR